MHNLVAKEIFTRRLPPSHSKAQRGRRGHKEVDGATAPSNHHWQEDIFPESIRSLSRPMNKPESHLRKIFPFCSNHPKATRFETTIQAHRNERTK